MKKKKHKRKKVNQVRSRKNAISQSVNESKEFLNVFEKLSKK